MTALERLEALVNSPSLRDDPDALILNVRVWIKDLQEVLRLARIGKECERQAETK